MAHEKRLIHTPTFYQATFLTKIMLSSNTDIIKAKLKIVISRDYTLKNIEDFRSIQICNALHFNLKLRGD